MNLCIALAVQFYDFKTQLVHANYDSNNKINIKESVLVLINYNKT